MNSNNVRIRMDLEHWRPVRGFPDYFISNYGNIVSLKKNKLKRLKPGVGSHGYYNIYLGNPENNKRKTGATIHTLVATAFLKQRPAERMVVNHLDGNKLNNRADNLEWCTDHENHVHAHKILGHYGGTPPVPVECVETGERYPTILDAAKAKNLHFGNLASVVRGERSTTGGFHWRKIEEAIDG